MAGSRYEEPTPELRPSEGPPTAVDIERLSHSLRVIAARRIGDWTAAEDIAQEAIRRAIEALQAGKVLNPAALPAFLIQTVVNLCLHHGRSAGRKDRALKKVEATFAGQSDDDALTELISRERRTLLREAVSRLEPVDREIIELTYGEELATPQIALRMNLEKGTVRVRRHRAIRRLAELLGVTRSMDREHKTR
jgi:RNA polymerase sigma-70 factor, ECF subfamily